MGINWLNEHKANIDCLAKTMECLDDQGNPVNIQGILHEVKPRQISAMQLKRCRRKGCEIFAVKIKDLREPLETIYKDDCIFKMWRLEKEWKNPSKEKYPLFRGKMETLQ